MTTYLISNAVTWIGLTTFQSGDALIVTPGGALVLPTTSLSDMGVAGATTISFGGYVALQSLAVDQKVTFGITATGQLVSSYAGAAIALHGAHLDTAGQITAANGTGVAMMDSGASLSNAGRIAGLTGISLGSTAARVVNTGLVDGTITGVLVTGDASQLRNSGTISGDETAVKITAAGSFALMNAGLIQGDILSTGDSRDVVRNSGTIAGDVSLGAGNDSYGGGRLQGDLDMGSGNDRVDARGFAVSGEITDTSGSDTYLVDSSRTRITDTGTGTDTVYAWCSYALNDGLEVLTLRGSNDLNGFGTAQANTLTGNAGDNRLLGGGGADQLLGGDGDDILRGGTGNDVLSGDQGADRLTGGAGVDRFVFADLSDLEASGASTDTITDFTKGVDQIDLSGIDADSSNGPTNDAFTFIGTAAFTLHAGEARTTTAAGQTQLELDVDGDGVADAMVLLSGTIALTASDFVL
ncbi:MAG: calcium-binding protein [Pseudomonadota bacterium]